MRYTLLFMLGLFIQGSSHAADINPSKQTLPDKFVNPGGKRYSIFAGDPERVQRANEVNVKDFSGELALEPKALSLSGQVSEGTAPNQFKLTLKVKNNGKRSYTLSFPDSQRFDIAITTPEGTLVYLWSEDKAFVQKEGTSFINSGESLAYSEFLPLEALKAKMTPGTYNVQMIFANYPEITARGTLQITP
jgi:Intracellular proteinase inhibitor